MQEVISRNGNDYQVIFYPGFGGQMLVFFPGIELIVVITAGNFETDSKSENFKIIEKYIIPSVISLK